MLDQILRLTACLALVSALLGCAGSSNYDQPEMKLTDPDNHDQI